MKLHLANRYMALIIAILGAMFGVRQWFGFGPNPGILIAWLPLPIGLRQYIVWAGIPIVVTLLYSITTRRVAVASIMTNIFVVMALLFYYVSYVVDLLFFNTNELLVDLHYETLHRASFFSFIRSSILPEFAEKLLLVLPLGFALAGLSVVIIRMCAFVDSKRRIAA